MVVAFRDRILQIVDLHVLVQIHEGLVIGMREDRPRGSHRRRLLLRRGGGLGPRVEAGSLRRLPAGTAAGRERRIEASGPRHLACGKDTGWELRDRRSRGACCRR